MYNVYNIQSALVLPSNMPHLLCLHRAGKALVCIFTRHKRLVVSRCKELSALYIKHVIHDNHYHV